jgi:hypothetical protein
MPNIINGQITLRPNEIYNTLSNMIISQYVFADNIKGTYGDLAAKFRVDGSMYGDSKVYYATDILKSIEWKQDQTSGPDFTNVLELHRAPAPKQQIITITNFRQIALTVDNYLSKRAWGTEGAFTQFNSVMLGWIRDTKKVYDSTLINSFVGTVESNIGKQGGKSTDITPIDGQNDALTIAVALADILTELKDVSRDYNDFGYMRSFDESDLLVVFNAKLWNQLRKADLPVVFHNEGLLDEFDKVVLPAKYFGTKVGYAHTQKTVPAEGVDVYRTLVEGDFGGVHLFPGEEIPEGATFYEDEAYKEDTTIAFKIMHKNSIPFMSAFETSTAFNNARNLSENHYLTWGYSDLDYLANYPLITRRFKEA